MATNEGDQMHDDNEGHQQDDTGDDGHQHDDADDDAGDEVEVPPPP